MKTRYNTTNIIGDWAKSLVVFVFLLSTIWGCESSTSDRLTAEEEMGVAMQAKLNDLRKATAKFHDVLEAERSGYAIATSFVANMGYHYVDGANVVDGEVDVMRPEALVYANDPPHIPDPRPGPPLLGNELRLVAVEYLLPGTGEEDPSQLPDVFEGDDDRWAYSDADGVWTLHAWIWFQNPSGIFHPTNIQVSNGN